MRKLIVSAVALGLALILYNLAITGNTAQQVVTFEVRATNEISVSGNPATLVVNGTTVGSQPVAGAGNAAPRAVDTNGITKKITYTLSVAATSGTASQVRKTVTATLTDL